MSLPLFTCKNQQLQEPVITNKHHLPEKKIPLPSDLRKRYPRTTINLFLTTRKIFCPHTTRILFKQNSFSVRKTVQGGTILHKVFFSTNKSLDFIINNRKMFGHNIRSSQLHGHIFAHVKIKAAISSVRNVCAPSPLSQADFPLGTKGNAPAAKLGIEGNLLAMK